MALQPHLCGPAEKLLAVMLIQLDIIPSCQASRYRLRKRYCLVGRDAAGGNPRGISPNVAAYGRNADNICRVIWAYVCRNG